MERSLASFNSLVQSKEFYEAEQSLKSAVQRRHQTHASECRAAVMHGVREMCEHRQTACAYELAQLLRLFPDDDDRQACTVEALGLLAGDSETDFAFRFLRESTPSRPLHAEASRVYAARGHDAMAVKHAALSGDSRAVAEQLKVWASKGRPDEVDLFFTRTFLQVLCVSETLLEPGELLVEARDVFGQQLTSLPLFHFCSFLCQAAAFDRRPVTLFTALKERYAPSLARDPDLNALLENVGQRYFGLEKIEKSGGSLMDMIQSIFAGAQ